MDGRVQDRVASYLRQRFETPYVDVVTEPGPVRILSEDGDGDLAASILRRVDLSVRVHASEGLAIVAHHDCAGNPVDEAIQREHLSASLDLLASRYPFLEVVALWVDAAGMVQEVASKKPTRKPAA